MTDLLIRPGPTAEGNRVVVRLHEHVAAAALLAAGESRDAVERAEVDAGAFLALGLLAGAAIERDGALSPANLRAAILAARAWVPYPNDRPAIASTALDRLALAADVVLSEALLAAWERGEPR